MIKIIKRLLGFVRCLIKGVSFEKKVYVGKNVSLKGRKKIRLKIGVSIRPYVQIWTKGNANIGENTDIGERCRISIINNIVIGKNVLISPNVYITDCDHEYRNIDASIMSQGVVMNDNSIYIGDDSYIGINAVIVGNVKIGKHCVIGANSVVTKNIPDYCVAVGVPAKVIKKYNFIKKQWE